MAKSTKAGSKNNKKTSKSVSAAPERAVKKRNNEVNIPVKEIVLLLFVAVNIFIFICNFGICGSFGDVISSFFYGIFGLVTYIFPIVLVIGTLFLIANKTNIRVIVKIVFIVLFLLAFSLFVALCYEGNDVISAKDMYLIGYGDKKGCGAIGAFFAYLLVPNVGLAGAFLLDIIIMMICFLVIFNKTFIAALDYFKERDDEEDFEEAWRKRKPAFKREVVEDADADESNFEETSRLRKDNKVTGVSFDTKIGANKVYDDDIKELKSDIPYEEEKPSRRKLLRRGDKVEETTAVTKQVEEPIFGEKNVVEEKTAPATPETIEPVDSGIDSNSDYVFPSIELLKRAKNTGKDNTAFLDETKNKLEKTLKDFGVDVTVSDVTCGPSVTRYEITPNTGVKVSKIVSLADDIKLNLAAADIRIEAPIPGKAAVGIEVPNKENKEVRLRDLIESKEFKTAKTKIPFTAGLDIAGNVIVSDIAKMPHVLIAGSTGSGKSVCINTIIMSILYKARPDEVKLIMVDPKVVELSVYNDIPHLLIPVVTDPKKAAAALMWAVNEMTERYKKFADENVRDLAGYNESIMFKAKEDPEELKKKMPQIVIIVDELADLMMVAPGDVEEAICRLAQLARAAGIHLVLATQRPSVNVITGLIKANMPSRVAFAVSSGVDSRTILDMNGAEKLLGKGDMLFYPQGYQKPLRVQGAFVSDEEVTAVCKAIKENNKSATSEHKNVEEEIQKKMLSSETMAGGAFASTDDGRDVYFEDAGRFIIEKERASIGLLQRQFKIGFNRAARIMDQLEEAGVVGPEEGTKPRRILLSMEEFSYMLENSEQ